MPETNTTRAVARAFLSRPSPASTIEPASTVASSQGGATVIRSAFARITKAAANASYVLPSILSQDCQPICVVVNVSGQTINIYCAANEKHNGSSNAALSVVDGAAAIFIPVQNSTAGTTDWRSAMIS